MVYNLYFTLIYNIQYMLVFFCVLEINVQHVYGHLVKFRNIRTTTFF